MQLRIGLTACLVAAAITAPGPSAATPVEGSWLTQERTSIVEIDGCSGDTLCGRLLWLRIRPSDNNPDAVDNRNPQPAQHRRKLCGLVIMSGLRPVGKNEWDGGALYDPQSGNTYSGKMTVRPDGTLSLRGYLGISIIGRSQIWTRFLRPTPQCPGQFKLN